MRDVRCPLCRSLLCRISGTGTRIEAKCTAKGGCRQIVVIDEAGAPTVKTSSQLARAS